MEPGMKFVLEQPQDSDKRKKRPRIVTSCDNCRLKKIKCIPAQSGPETPCAACAEAGYACKYGDRERYYAERKGSIQPAAIPQSRPASRSSMEQSFAVDKFPAEAMPASSFTRWSISRTYVQPQAHTSSSGQREAQLDDSSGSRSHEQLRNDNVQTSSSSLPLSNEVSSRFPFRVDPSHSVPGECLPLFDPIRTQYPHLKLMPVYIQSFFESMAGQCAFLEYEDTIRQFVSQNLDPLLANAIAAVGSLTAVAPGLSGWDLTHVSEVYCDTTKSILNATSSPRVAELKAIILVAWSEHKRGKASAFTKYAQRAMDYALDLGLSDARLLNEIARSSAERIVLQAIWASVVRLHVMPAAG